jgi:hypothetical protein
MQDQVTTRASSNATCANPKAPPENAAAGGLNQLGSAGRGAMDHVGLRKDRRPGS